MVRSNIRDRNILFLSRDNGSLSLIAEAIATKLLPPKTQVFAACLTQNKIDPKAVQVLREIGINVLTEEAKGLDVVPTQDIDLIVRLGEPVRLSRLFLPAPSVRLGTYLIPAKSPRQILTHSVTPEMKSTTR